MKKFLVALAIFLATLTSANAIAVQNVSAAVAKKCQQNSFFGFPHWYKYLDVGKKGSDKCAITGPKEPSTDEFSLSLAIPRILLAVAEILLRIAGMVAVGFVMFGGFRYITSQGEPESLKNAKDTVINALIGLAVAALAVGIVNAVGSALW